MEGDKAVNRWNLRLTVLPGRIYKPLSMWSWCWKDLSECSNLGQVLERMDKTSQKRTGVNHRENNIEELAEEEVCKVNRKAVIKGQGRVHHWCHRS